MLLHGVPNAELHCGVQTRLAAYCICSCLVFQYCFLSPRAPWVGKRICVASYRLRCHSWVLYGFQSLWKARLTISLSHLSSITWMVLERNTCQGVVETFISVAGSIDPANYILLQWLYFSYIEWLMQTVFNQFMWWMLVNQCSSWSPCTS